METWQHKARLNGSQTGQTGDILSPQKKLLQSNEYKENLISWACVCVYNFMKNGIFTEFQILQITSFPKS